MIRHYILNKIPDEANLDLWFLARTNFETILKLAAINPFIPAGSSLSFSLGRVSIRQPRVAGGGIDFMKTKRSLYSSTLITLIGPTMPRAGPEVG